jgi:hypothetical protein
MITMAISRFEIINSAIMEIGINYDDANYLTDPIYNVANTLFDQVIDDSLSNVNFEMTRLITNLNRDFSDPIEYRDVIYYPYQMPVDTIYTISIEPSVLYKVMRGKIYIAKENDVKMIHCSKTRLSSISTVMRQYIISFLAYKICRPLNKAHLVDELFGKMLYFKEQVQNANFDDRIDVWGTKDEDYGIY